MPNCQPHGARAYRILSHSVRFPRKDNVYFVSPSASSQNRTGAVHTLQERCSFQRELCWHMCGGYTRGTSLRKATCRLASPPHCNFYRRRSTLRATVLIAVNHPSRWIGKGAGLCRVSASHVDMSYKAMFLGPPRSLVAVSPYLCTGFGLTRLLLHWGLEPHHVLV